MNVFLLLDIRSVLLHAQELGRGILTTLELSVAVAPAAMILGLVLAFGRISVSKILYVASTGYIELFRNTPGLVQIYFIFFVLPLYGLPFSPFVTAVIALAANHAAFFAEIYRGAIGSVSRRQKEAGRALGLRRWQIMRLVILPQMFRDAIPPIGNELIALTLNTSVASIIGVSELTHEANVLGDATASTFFLYVFAGAAYLAITVVFSFVLRGTEHRFRLRR